MVYYLIVCKSLTYAQRTAEVLERAGISARILRSPRQIAGSGCSHSVKIAERSLNAALRALRRGELAPTSVFVTQGDNSYREVLL